MEANINFFELADLTHNFTAAQINKIILDTKRSVYTDIVKNIDKNSIVTQEKLKLKIQATDPELTDEIIKQYRSL